MTRLRRVACVGAVVAAVLSAVAAPAEGVPILDPPITGTVTDEATGAPIAGICVEGLGFGIDDQAYWPTAVTDDNGRYSLDTSTNINTILFPPAFSVEFIDCADLGYAGEFYDNVTSRDEATRVAKGASGVDAALTPLGTTD